MDIQWFINEIKTINEDCNGDAFIEFLDEHHNYICDYDKKEYLKEIENIQDVGLKYLLHAIIEEVMGSINCAKLYKLASKNDCTIALNKLARLYDGGDMFRYDVGKATYYYYLYHKKINDMTAFNDSCWLNDGNDEAVSEFMESYCGLISQNNELHKQCNLQTSIIQKQRDDIKKLKERITELEYTPNGVGYNECKEHFDSLIEKKLE